MKRFALIVCCVLFSALSFAQVTTVYTLDGNYLVETSKSHSPSWIVSSECIDKGGNLHYQSGGGSESSNVAVYGVANFNGSSGVTFKVTEAGVFDQAASNATVKITWSTDGTCTVLSVNNGHAVYDPPVPYSVSGTYSLTTHTTSGIGTGVITLAVGTEINFFEFQATGAYVQCFVPSSSKELVVLSTITLNGHVTKEPNKIVLSGTAQHTNRYVNPCLVASAANSGF